MAFDTQTITHVNSFNVVNTVEGVNTATREIFEGIKTENINFFEGLMLRNTFIASKNYTGGMDQSIASQQASPSNPAGSYRSLLTPKGDTLDFKPIANLGEVKFEQFGADDIVLKMDSYIKTPNTQLYQVDGNGGWLVNQIEGALASQAISALYRENNYAVFETLKEGALYQTDNRRGHQGRILVSTANEGATLFTNELIDALASYGATPEDRYVTGFDEPELVVSIPPEFHAQLLKEKLVIFEGMVGGNGSAFYQGLPYTHKFAGSNVIRTKYLNKENTIIRAKYIITPLGGYSPFLFHLGRFGARADIAPGTDGAIFIYGTLLTGMKVEPKLDQHITMKIEGLTIPATDFTGSVKNLSVVKKTGTSSTLKGTVVGTIGTVNVYKYGSTTSVFDGELAIGEDSTLDLTGLVAEEKYHVVIKFGTESHTYSNGEVKTNSYNFYFRQG